MRNKLLLLSHCILSFFKITQVYPSLIELKEFPYLYLQFILVYLRCTSHLYSQLSTLQAIECIVSISDLIHQIRLAISIPKQSSPLRKQPSFFLLRPQTMKSSLNLSLSCVSHPVHHHLSPDYCNSFLSALPASSLVLTPLITGTRVIL